MNDNLLSTLKQLRLSGLAESLEVRLQEAASGRLNHREFLELILQDELLVRGERLLTVTAEILIAFLTKLRLYENSPQKAG